MKLWTLGVIAALSSCGCTMLSLERHTVGQSDSAVDLRYKEVLNNLAMIARDRSALPAYSSIFSGTIFVQDQGQFVSTNNFPFHAPGVGVGVGSISTNPSLNRQISQNWTLDPIITPEKLEAMRACCQWAIGGPANVHPESMSLLVRPDQAPPGPERHFSVYERLSHLPPCWLGVGKHQEVPVCALYKAYSGDVWVWVTPEGMRGLTDFTLIFQDIARVSINSPTLFNLPPTYIPILFETADTANEPKKRSDTNLYFTVQATVDQSGQLVTNVPYQPLRVDNLGVDAANIRSAISAAGISAVPH